MALGCIVYIHPSKQTSCHQRRKNIPMEARLLNRLEYFELRDLKTPLPSANIIDLQKFKGLLPLYMHLIGKDNLQL